MLCPATSVPFLSSECISRSHLFDLAFYEAFKLPLCVRRLPAVTRFQSSASATVATAFCSFTGIPGCRWAARKRCKILPCSSFRVLGCRLPASLASTLPRQLLCYCGHSLLFLYWRPKSSPAARLASQAAACLRSLTSNLPPHLLCWFQSSAAAPPPLWPQPSVLL